MGPKPGRAYESDGAGLYVRKGKLVDVGRIIGSGRFQGPIVHCFEGAAVLAQHAPGRVNLCQSDVFERTYIGEDGSACHVADLPVGFTVHPLGTDCRIST